MKKVCIIGSPATQGNYRKALQKAGCDAVIFPSCSYHQAGEIFQPYSPHGADAASAANSLCPPLRMEKLPDSFDGLLLPGGGDVPHSLSDYPFSLAKNPARAKDSCPPETIPVPDTRFSCPGKAVSISDTRFTHPNRAAMPSCPASASMTLNLRQLTELDIKQFTALSLEQLAVLDIFYRAEKPVLGICKGMQLINLYFHGTIGEVPNRKLHQNPNHDIFHPAENLPGTFMHAFFGADMTVNSSHHQCIETLGENLQAVQFAPDHTIEAVTHLSAPIFGTQWHPERMMEQKPDISLLFRYFVSLL